MAATNLFTSAKVKPAKKPKAAASVNERTVAGLETYASLWEIKKMVEGLLATAKEPVDAQCVEFLTLEGTAIKRKPESFKAKEGIGNATVILSKRSSNSPLSELEQHMFEVHGIETETVDVVSDAFMFNPAHDGWLQENGAAVSKALSKIPGFPEDLIVKQEGRTKVVTTENSLNQLFTKPVDVVRQMLRTVGTLMLKPTVQQQDMQSAVMKLKNMIQAVQEKAETDGK